MSVYIVWLAVTLYCMSWLTFCYCHLDEMQEVANKGYLIPKDEKWLVSPWLLKNQVFLMCLILFFVWWIAIFRSK